MTESSEHAEQPVPLRKSEQTQQRILEAARTCFAQLGYERATIRTIAAAANADKSSVVKYFGSKQQLFRQAVHFDIPIDELTSADPTTSAESYLRSLLAGWAADPNSPMAVLLRTSMTSDEAAQLLRDRVEADSMNRIAKHMDLPDADVRSGLFAAIMIGIASGRYLLKLPNLADADLDEVIRIATPVVRALISPGN